MSVESIADALGARIFVAAGGNTQMRELSCGPLEYNPALFGLGEVDFVERVTVRWPSGKVQLVHDPAVGGIVTVVENDDQDGDGAVDTQDNCLVTANENQIDSDDDDGYGNACDGTTTATGPSVSPIS